MRTECSTDFDLFGPVEGRRVAADFDGGAMTSDAGGLLLGSTDRAIGLVDRFAGCLRDGRAPGSSNIACVRSSCSVFSPSRSATKTSTTMTSFATTRCWRRWRASSRVGARIARRWLASRRSIGSNFPVLSPRATTKSAMTRQRSRPCSSTSSSRRMHGRPSRSFSTSTPPTTRCTAIRKAGSSTAITTATAIFPYTCSVAAICWRPSSGPRTSTATPARLRRSPASSAGSARWPKTRILLRADSGFAREALMAWCEMNRVDFLFGLARNGRLVEEIAVELLQAEAEASAAGAPARRYKDFRYSTLDSWSRRRRVVAKAEWTEGEANPRFIVTSLSQAETNGRFLYEKVYCARGDMENRIKECQGDLFADRTSAATMRANQLRLWFASMAYALLSALRRIALAHTQFAEATCGTIRLKLLKIGALVSISVRRIRFALASACP